MTAMKHDYKNKEEEKSMKGVSNAVIGLVLFIVVIAIVVVSTGLYLALRPAVPVEKVVYDGEFDDGFLASKGWFFSDFIEAVDCNITNDVLGQAEDTTCVYNSTVHMNSSYNSRDFYISWVFDIDGPIKDLEIDGSLKNSDTLQAKDDFTIVDAKIYTHEDSPVEMVDLRNFIEDQVEIDGNTGPLDGDEYVFWVHLRSKAISPAASAGGTDDIFVLHLSADTSGDTDEAYATFQSAHQFIA